MKNSKRNTLRGLAAASLALACGLPAGLAVAADPIKIGLILPMTGQQATTGRQIDAAVGDAETMVPRLAARIGDPSGQHRDRSFDHGGARQPWCP